MAAITFNTFGPLQHDAPAVRLYPNYPDPPAIPAEQAEAMSAALIKAAKLFDVLVAGLPLSEGGEEAQLKRIAELQAENDTIGLELQRQLEAAEDEKKQVEESFSQTTFNCLNLKKAE